MGGWYEKNDEESAYNKKIKTGSLSGKHSKTSQQVSRIKKRDENIKIKERASNVH